MHKVLLAPCIIRDARDVHEEHHGKNAEELICKPPNSFHVSEKYGIMHAFRNNVDLLFSERPPINTARDHSKEKATTPIWLSSRGKNQSTIQQNAVNNHTFHKDHRQLM
ncbi:hypothetical protein TcCL_Unassigned05075, partial [Trypanosoma cruzi]